MRIQVNRELIENFDQSIAVVDSDFRDNIEEFLEELVRGCEWDAKIMGDP